MERTTSVEGHAANMLVGALEEMLAELAGNADGSDIGWLRPLAVLSAEIEYNAPRSSEVDSVNLADECRELSNLLGGLQRAVPRLDDHDALPDLPEPSFVSRYTLARDSLAMATLHDHALAACRAISACHALTLSAA
jgi:hypothetical protein